MMVHYASQEVPAGDILLGAMILVGFLIGVYVVGRFLNNWKNRRFNVAWAPLIPLINGTVQNDGGGAATSWLTGTYRGKQVQASMVPDRNLYQEGNGRYNYFDTALRGVAGQQNWQIIYRTPVLGIGTSGWCIEGEDEALNSRLQAANIITEIAHLGNPTIAYTARDHTLRYSDDITPLWAPSSERFQAILELLLRLAAISENVAAA